MLVKYSKAIIVIHVGEGNREKLSHKVDCKSSKGYVCMLINNNNVVSVIL